MFRSPLDLEVLAAAHRDDLQRYWSVSTATTGAGQAAGPLTRTRWAMGRRLIALGERLSDQSERAALSSASPLRPADGRAR